MTEEKPATLSLDELIAKYERSRDDRNRIRFVITATITAIVLLFIFYGYLEVDNFASNQIPEFGAALANEASAIAPTIAEDLNSSVTALLPVFNQAFYQTIDENQGKMVDILLNEYQSLHHYAQEKWPAMEKAIAEMVLAQEENARQCLSQHVAAEKLAGIGAAYNQAISEYMSDFFQKRFGEDIVVAEEIVAKLQLLSDSEPNMAPADAQFILGMLIELLGMQMQIHRAGPQALTE